MTEPTASEHRKALRPMPGSSRRRGAQRSAFVWWDRGASADVERLRGVQGAERATRRAGKTARWWPLAMLALAQIAYPLVEDHRRAVLVVLTVMLGFAVSAGHAVSTRGWRAAAALVVVTAGGGLVVEAVGVATGFPFGSYAYAAALGPRVLGVPVVIPLAWAWMAWPAWVVAAHLVTRPATRVAVASVALATWDLFLDPQMVAAGYWRWSTVDIPVRNYLTWLVVAAVMMTMLLAAVGQGHPDFRADAPVLALYLWTYASSVLAHAVFLDLPRSALWGGLGMGLIAVPLTVALVRR